MAGEVVDSGGGKSSLDILNADDGEGVEDGELQGKDEAEESEGERELRDVNEDGEESGEETGDAGESGEGGEDDREGDEEVKEKEAKEKEEKEEQEELAPLGKRGKAISDKLKGIDKDIFKKVPELKPIIFRDNDMGKIFPTIHEAKFARERLEVFGQVEGALGSGDSSLILSSLGKNNPEALAKFATDFLPTLLSGSQELYVKATVPIIRNAILSARREAKATGDKNLENAALLITKHIFGDFELPKDDAGRTTLDPEKEQFNREKREFYQRQTVEFVDSVKTTGVETLWGEVSRALKPYKLASFVERSATEAIMSDIFNELNGDRDHQNVMKQYWSEAQKGLSSELKSKLTSAFLRRARASLSTVRDRRLREFLGKDFKKDFVKPGGNNKSETTPLRREIVKTSGKRIPQKTDKIMDPRDIDYRRTSSMDILEGRITPKR